MRLAPFEGQPVSLVVTHKYRCLGTTSAMTMTFSYPFFVLVVSLGVESLNPKTGNLTPAAAREASYTYEHDTIYSGATYRGMWLNGKPHGQ